MNKLALILGALILSGCATSQTPEEREWARAQARLNWENCQQAYRDHIPSLFLHYQHEPGEERPIDITSDLAFNECKRVLGSEWVQ